MIDFHSCIENPRRMSVEPNVAKPGMTLSLTGENVHLNPLAKFQVKKADGSFTMVRAACPSVFIV
jgi:hypothetical protein